MTSSFKQLARPLCAALLGVLLAAPAYATATWTWALDTNGTTSPNPCTGAPAVGYSTMSTSCSAAGASTPNKATFTGWANTGGKSGSTEVGGGSFEAAKMYSWGNAGYGIVNKFESPSATGPHATDNVGALELFLVKFDAAVSLSEVKVGWNGNDNPSTGYNDADISIYRFGTGASPGSLAGLTASNLTGAGGWQFVKNYGNAGNYSNNTVDLKAGSFDTGSSSWWLISAYNSNSGGGFGSSDAFKLLSIGATAATAAGAKVPEPATLALVAVAVLGAAGARRRKRS